MNPSEYIPNYDQIKIGEWYKDGLFWRRKSADHSDGKGDLIFNTCYKIFMEKDKSDWAYNSLEACATLLLDRKRWPDRMSDDTDCKTGIGRFINRTTRDILKVFGITIHPNFRYQGRMSRDPFKALYTLSIFLGQPGYIKEVPLPMSDYSPPTWRWRRRLIKDKRKFFVKRLGYLEACAVDMNFVHEDKEWLSGNNKP